MAETKPNFSEGITTTLECPEPWQRVIKVEITRDEYDKEYTRRLKKARKGHQMRGHRKGHSPLAVVEKEMGTMVRMDAIEALVPRAYMAGVVEHKINPITEPALENLEWEDETAPLTFDLMVEVRPEIETVDFENIPVKKREVEVTDEALTEVLDRLRESKARFEIVEREAAKDDQVTLDLTPAGEDGSPDPGQKIEDQQLILGAESNMPAFNEAMAGVKAGETRVVEVLYPEDHPNEALKGKTMSFHCDIKQVAEKVLPELDDELAASFEEGKTLEDLKQDIRDNLAKEQENTIAQEMDRQIQEELVRRNDVPVPPSMVERYLAQGLEDLHNRNQQVGRPNTPEEDAQYREAGKPHAEKALQLMFIMEAIQSKEEIKVTDQDVDERIVELAAQSGIEDVERYREFFKSGDELSRMKYDILERRTHDFLLSRAQIETVPADTKIFAEEE
jgi:trigger factor